MTTNNNTLNTMLSELEFVLDSATTPAVTPGQAAVIAALTPPPPPTQEEIDARWYTNIAASIYALTSAHTNLYPVRFHPKDFLRPKLDENGEVKARQFYRVGQMVKVYTRISNWGEAVTDMNIVGQIVEVLDDHLKVRALAGRKDSPSYVRIRRGDSNWTNAGRVVTVTKRSATILDPYAVPDTWYAYANYYYVKSRERRLQEARRRREESRPHDPRLEFRKWHFRAARHSSAITSTWWKKNTSMDATVKLFIKSMRNNDMAAINVLPWTGNANAAFNIALEVIRGATGYNFVRTSCGHFTREDQRVNVYNSYMERRHYCPACIEATSSRFLKALNAAGETVYVERGARLYLWSDGTQRIEKEPPIIGAYHSSKKYIKALPMPNGAPMPKDTLTMGFELEMESASGYLEDDEHRNRLARAVKVRMDNATKALGLEGKMKYAFFERDGSVDYGFEMVTSYGSLELHREMVTRIFGPIAGEDTDTTPFVGQLRSHEASSSCGLHVHMAKPQSLIHAVKLQAFFNDPENKRLIRAVARRYSVNYARVMNGKTKETVKQSVVSAIRSQGRITDRGYDADYKRQLTKCAISSLSNGDRYQQVNFNNDATVEIRVYKGSMLPTTIMACLEFSAAVWKFCEHTMPGDLTTEKFLKWISRPSLRADTGYLRSYLAVRGYEVYQPNPKKGERLTMGLNELNAEDA